MYKEDDTMFPESELVPGSHWKHLKGGGVYEIVGVSFCATNGEEEGNMVVVYKPTYQSKIWLFHRSVAQFLDGRFQPIQNYPCSEEV
jgi:hypothetical protein